MTHSLLERSIGTNAEIRNHATQLLMPLIALVHIYLHDHVIDVDGCR